MLGINLIEVAAAGVVAMILGAIWYGPLFGKQWMQFAGITQTDMENAKQKGMAKSYAFGLVGQLLTAYVLAYLISLTGSYSLQTLIPLVGWIWLGLVVPILLGSVLWEGKSWKLFFLNGVYNLVTLMVMGLVIMYLA